MAERTYYDPLHQSITLNSEIKEEAMVMELIDSNPFQRLRRIKQLGTAYLTFHGAESSRFTHSLGVFHIARRALDRLTKINNEFNKFRGILYGSALLHDLGHGPLSHTSEEIFGIKHEEWSSRIIKEHPEIKGPLNKLDKTNVNKISNLIQYGESTNKLILSLISSQLDCDRLDYLMRDSYSTGTRYGQIDLERILSAITIAPDGDLAIQPKGIMAVEHYLIIRNLMYKSVYNHRLNEVCTWLLKKIISTARSLGPKDIWADKYMSEWLWNSKAIDIETFLANDDILTGYHISRWKEEAPKKLAILCERLIDRKLLKALNIANLKKEIRIQSLAICRQLAEKEGLNPDLSCGIREYQLQSYYPYRSGLRVWDGEKLQALEDVSSLVNVLIKPDISSWLIYPGIIHQELKKEINILFDKQNN